MQQAACALQQNTVHLGEHCASVEQLPYSVQEIGLEMEGMGRNRTLSDEHPAGSHLAINSLSMGTYICHGWQQ